MATKKLSDLAKTIRSKNAGANHFTLDIIFDDFETYERVRETDVITRDLIRELYGVEDEQIAQFVHYPPGNAIKITLRRPITTTIGLNRCSVCQHDFVTSLCLLASTVPASCSKPVRASRR